MRLLATLLGAFLLLPLSAEAERVLDTVQTDLHRLQVVEVADGLRYPWGLAFLPDGGFLVTEKPGTLVRLSGDGNERTEINGVPEVYDNNQGGLLDVALDPDFAANGWVYLTYSAVEGAGAHTRLARGKLAGDELQDVEVLFIAEPASRGGRHFGSRIAFLPDGTVAITVGERGLKTPSQNLLDHGGSVIRLHRDGSVPKDNPFRGGTDTLAEIYSYGHRNAQGMILHPETGKLWLHEHGPRGGDEVNIVEPGANYGWPLVSHGVNYSGSQVGRGQKTAPGITDPVHVWTPSIAPSGMAYYDGAAFPEWQGDLLVGALKFQLVVRLDLEGERVVAEERFLEDALGRIRDVRVGPDGLVYLLTDARNGRLLRLEPAD